MLSKRLGKYVSVKNIAKTVKFLFDEDYEEHDDANDDDDVKVDDDNNKSC